ncbi:GNAT family N-acetyltransferase [Sporocytophaga myxococcoides]|uniref:GNAT family N-acetyltransferase n=1 Tax=Sporocytophaga myxococcoides TaxID=153721 RepID=UPI000408D812|nr:GNAT family N-acetyltransferase [Sporocytophaga myxococcoides]
MVQIKKVVSFEELEMIKELFKEYEQYLNTDLCFQSFKEELQSLPGCYSSPDGGLWLAFDNNKPVGCVALKKQDSKYSEMKRLYVKPEYHGNGIGKKLIEATIQKSRELGYEFVRLDVLPKSEIAIAIYKSLGFSPIPPYYQTNQEVYFFELKLKNRI